MEGQQRAGGEGTREGVCSRLCLHAVGSDRSHLSNPSHSYTLATSLSNSLDTTSTSLTSLIQTLNALSPSLAPSSSAQTPEDPLTQIAAILNAHLGSLKWIEGTTEGLKKSVRELEGRVGEVGARMGQSQGVGSSSVLGMRSGTPGRGTASPFARRG
jgi:nuclear pore complex protein Nup62